MFISALLLAGATQVGAASTDAANLADLRCVVALSAAVSSVPDAQRLALQGGVMFFYGRITGRSPNFDVEGRMVALMKADPQGKSFARENMRCGGELQAHGKKLMQIGQRIATGAAK